jgi:hypothetical protein
LIKKVFLYILILSHFISISHALCVNFADSTDAAGVPGNEVGNGVAFADYDNDGDLDIYVSADPHDVLYRNEGDGTFQDVTINSDIFVLGDGVGVAFGDYDNDGDLDLYIPVNDRWDIFFQNEGEGVFRDVSDEVRIDNPNRARSATFADFDRDGFLDIYVVNENTENILYKNLSGRIFENVSQVMNVAHRGPGRCSVWGDYDNDGDLDLYVTNKGAPNVLYRNDKSGFKDVTEQAGVTGPGASTGVAFADYNNDGNLDIYVDGDKPFLYQNNGDGTFADVAEEAGISHSGRESTPAFGDYDYDGDLDLYLAVWQGKSLMYRNNGDGTFADVTEESGMGIVGNSWGAVFGDYDQDGDLDLYTTYTTRPNILYQNNGNGNNWLYIQLKGSSSNRDGIGTRIELTTEGVTQIREVSGGSGYGSQNSLIVEFGLGANEIADEIKIIWQSEIVTKLTKVKANQIILAEESFWAVEEPSTKHSGPDRRGKDTIESSCLLPNYPNPFNPETWIPYQLADPANVKITIYDTAGRLIHTLNLGYKQSGIYRSKTDAAYWDGRNENGEHVAAGMLFHIKNDTKK